LSKRFFLQLLEHERNLKAMPAESENRWQQNEGDPK
jgi:hypothetical protein